MNLLRNACDLGVVVRNRRRMLKWSQVKLATFASVGRPWLAELEKGKPGAPLNLVMQTLAALGCEIYVSVSSPTQVPSVEPLATHPGAGIERPGLVASGDAKAVGPPTDHTKTSFTTGSPPRAEQVYEDGHRAALTSLVAEIVSKEAPMFETYLARRVASLCGLSRASTKFAQLVADITEGKFPKSLENERMIVWPENENTHVLISFRESDRDHVDIPLAELASVAMQYLARGSTEEHTLGSMRRKLRLSNIKSSTRRRFVEAINLAKAHLSPEPPS